jgi:opacity protein-like surface antigen
MYTLFLRTLLATSIFLPISSVLQAATDQELTQLRAQIISMQQQLEAQATALREMSARIEPLVSKSQTKTTTRSKAPSPQAAPQSNSRTAAANVSENSPVIKEAPVSKSTETVYQEQHALFNRKFSLDTGLSYSYSDRRDLFLNGFLALDAIFLGNISVDSIKAETLTLDFTGRYSPTNRLQFDLNIPFLKRKTTFSSVGAGFSSSSVTEASVTANELGDISAGVFYRLIPESYERADTVISLRVKAPTGKEPYGIKFLTINDGGQNLNVPTQLPTGNGVWAATAGISFIKTVDPAILYTNFAYTFNFEDKFSDISSDPTLKQAGEINLGNQLSLGGGMAFALSEKLSLSLGYTHQLSERSSVNVEGSSSQDINGSDARSGVVNFGVTYGFADNLALQVGLGLGVTPDAPDVRIGFNLPYSF